MAVSTDINARALGRCSVFNEGRVSTAPASERLDGVEGVVT